MKKFKTKYNFVGEWNSEEEKELAKKLFHQTVLFATDLIDPYRTYVMKRFKRLHPDVSLDSPEFRIFKAESYNTAIANLVKMMKTMEEIGGLPTLVPFYDYKFETVRLTITNDKMGQLYLTGEEVKETK